MAVTLVIISSVQEASIQLGDWRHPRYLTARIQVVSWPEVMIEGVSLVQRQTWL